MKKKIKKAAEELQKICGYPVEVYSSEGLKNVFILMVRQQQTRRNLDDWAINEAYPMYWKIQAYLDEHKLSAHTKPMFFCDDKLLLFAKNNVLAGMENPPRGEWFDYDEPKHFLGYTYDIDKILEFLTKTKSCF